MKTRRETPQLVHFVVVIVAISVVASILLFNRSDSALTAKDRLVDSLIASHTDFIDSVLAEDTLRQIQFDSLTAATTDVAASVLVTRTHTDTLIVTIPDTTLRRQMADAIVAERATADSLHRLDSLRIELLQVQIVARDAIIDTLRLDLSAMTALRDAWRQKARGRWNVAVTLGPGVHEQGVSLVQLNVGLSYRVGRVCLPLVGC